METETKRITVCATTGIAPTEYGGNICLQLHAPDAPRTLAAERLMAATAYRAAAEIEEAIVGISTCAVCVEAHDGRIHLEFAINSTAAEEQAALEVLDSVAGQINQRANRKARCSRW